MKKVLKYIALGLLVLFVGSAAFMLKKPSWPKAEALPADASKIKRKCQVIRDTFDTPHIMADTQAAAYYCLGKIHALDRAWQMDYLRRMAYGRMSELYGFKYVRSDFMLRLMDLEAQARKWEIKTKKKFPKTYRIFQYYAWGINSGFKEIKSRGPVPYAFRKVGLQLAPWRIKDSLAIMMLQGFSQTRKTFTSDLSHMKKRLRLGLKRYHELYGPQKGMRMFDTTIIKPGEHSLLGRKASLEPGKSRQAKRKWAAVTPIQKKQKLEAFRQMEKFFAIPKWQKDYQATGSNNWVVSPKLTKNGYALLANDPHLAITTPNFWYESHIKTKGLNVMGVGVPGIAVTTAGHNENVAWGITNGYTNVADIVPVKIKNNRFQLGKKTIKAETFYPVVKVRVGPFYVPIFWQKFQRTNIGPILPIPWKKGVSLLLRWSGFHMNEGTTLPPLLALGNAKNVKHVEKLLRRIELPCWNLVFADKEGNIGYRQIGQMPRRHDGIHGFIDPNNKRHRWYGFLMDEEKPFAINPKKGFIVTANNRTFPPNYPYYTGHSFIHGYRASSIERLLRKYPKHSLKTMMKIQTDTEMPFARILLERMIKRLEKNKVDWSDLERNALEILKKWNKRAEKEEVGATIFQVWVDKMESMMFKDDKVTPGAPAIVRVFQGKILPGSSLKVEKILLLSFQHTLKKLSKDLGPDVQKWRWGRYHRNDFRHILRVGSKKGFSPGSQPAPGGDETINVAPHRGPGPYRTAYAASMRLVVELGPRIRSYGVVPGRNRDISPSVLSKQQKLWLNGQYRARPFYTDEVIKHQKSRMAITW